MKKKTLIPIKKELFDKVNIAPAKIWGRLESVHGKGWSYSNWNRMKRLGATPEQFKQAMKATRDLFGDTATFLSSVDAMDIINKYK